jgi:AcrR family transcriptional regulator
LLSALTNLLEAKPLASISVDAITAAAGVTRPAFYFYFPTKAAAVAALIRDLFTDMVAATTAFFEVETGTPRERLRESLTSGARTWHRHGTLVCALFDAAGADPDIRVILESWIDEFIVHTAHRIDQERAAGRAPDGIAAHNLATVLINMKSSYPL